MPNPRPEPPAAIKSDGTFVLPLWLRVVSSLPLFILAMLIVPPGLSGGWVSVVLRMLIVVLILGFVVRSFQLKLVLGDDVTIVNWRSTRKLPWSDVDAFGHDRRGLWVRRRNKQEVLVAAFALGRSLPPVRKQAKAVAEQLEEIRKKRRGPGKGRKRY